MLLPNPAATTRHHLVPTSRGGSDDEDNVVLIPDERHRAWHQVFRNQTPEEVLQHILNVLPPRSIDCVRAHRPNGYSLDVYHLSRPKLRTNILEAWEYLFPVNHPLLVLHLWHAQWVPPQYFQRIVAVQEGDHVDLLRFDPNVLPPLFVNPPGLEDLPGLGLPEPYTRRSGRRRRVVSHRPKPPNWDARWRWPGHFLQLIFSDDELEPTR